MRYLPLFAAILPCLLFSAEPQPMPKAADSSPALVTPVLADLPAYSFLDQPAQPMTTDEADMATVFYGIARTYHFNVNVDPALKGSLKVKFQGGTLRDLLNSIVEPNDLYMIEGEKSVSIKVFRTELYLVEFPKAKRSSSASTSVNLSPSNNNTSSYTGSNGTTSSSSRSTNTSTSGGSNDSSSGDTSSILVKQQNDDDFWKSISDEINANKTTEERVSINSYSGIVSITGRKKRHEEWKQYIDLLNLRINAQVLVEMRLCIFSTSDQKKQGVDWSQVVATSGAVSLNSLSTSTNITSLQNQTLTGDSLIGNFSTGKLSMVLRAMSAQGDVKTLIKPTVRVMHNATAFVKDGTDESFYSLYTDLSIDSTQTSGNQVVTKQQYTDSRQTFGIVFPVTAHISHDGYVSLIIEPARTELKSEKRSPDGKSSSPITGDQRISTILRMKDGESAIIGGLSNNTESKATNGVPYLSKVPVLGGLFRTDASSKSTSELIMIISAKIIK
jgi:type II secretory pathway component GspD/PulD (secretin)